MMFKYCYGRVKELHVDQRGQGMAEYGLIIALVAVVAIIGFRLLGSGVNHKINDAANALK
ncbi:MAG: Flp family type IVb pilin [Firmicutes bacterium]|nr:Flp family type IVb pilin [Bacillota bacterium]